MKSIAVLVLSMSLGVSLMLLCTPVKAEHSGQIAVTTWWVIFNNPEKCATQPCALSDLFVEKVKGCVWHATGSVSNASNGEVILVASLYKMLPSAAANLCLIGSQGLQNASGAEIHLIVRSHGARLDDPDQFVAQVATFNGGCSVNLCEDVQFAVHLPGDADADGNSSSMVNFFSDGQPVSGAESTLSRTDSSVTMTIRTSL